MPIKLISILALISISALVVQLFNQPVSGQFVVNVISEPVITAVSKNNSQELFTTDFASHETTHEVHSATAIELANNNIMAFWYGGSREGHKDVKIYQNTWDSSEQKWAKESSVITRVETRDATSRYIRKLGNPVVTRGPDNAIWLFYVSVSIGGWAGSSINLIVSQDEGINWSDPKRLITSPFLNISTLLKGSAIHFTDGTIGLPVYHEFLGKFGELIRLDSSGEVIDKQRLSWGKTTLQPVIIPFSSNQALSMMRYQGAAPHRILAQTSSDSGLNWTPLKKTQLPNPNAGIHAIRLFNGQLLLAFNNHEAEREDMSLAISSNNGQNWKLQKTVEQLHLDIPDKKTFSYPWLLQTQNGRIHLLYTWHKSHIKHRVFNTAWLEDEANKTRPIMDKIAEDRAE